MERINYVPNLLAMYIRNTREIYDITAWLQDTLIKKINKPCKLLYKYDGITPTKQEKQEAAREHAKYILDSVQYFIQNANRG